ncbi:MAG: hypothetical protein CMJ58_28880 [Planctomycetaceae bacterium]|nr:hypothetical protein [Planctomycetaceae bacterium]
MLSTHERVAPALAIVVVTELHSSNRLVTECVRSLGERHRSVTNLLAHAVSRDYFNVLPKCGNISEERVEGRLVQGGLMEVGNPGHHSWFLGETIIITAFWGAGQTAWQSPHPVQADAFTWGTPSLTPIAPSTGHRSTHVEQKRLR